MAYLADPHKLILGLWIRSVIEAILKQINAFDIQGCNISRSYAVGYTPDCIVFEVILPCGNRITLTGDGKVELTIHAQGAQSSTKLMLALSKLWDGIFTRINYYTLYDNWNNMELTIPYCDGSSFKPDILPGTYAKQLPPGMDMRGIIVRHWGIVWLTSDFAASL